MRPTLAFDFGPTGPYQLPLEVSLLRYESPPIVPGVKNLSTDNNNVNKNISDAKYILENESLTQGDGSPVSRACSKSEFP